MNGFILWAKLLWKHWVILVGGAFIGIILPIGERLGWWTMPNLWYSVLIFGVCVIWASFKVWKKEHEKVLAEHAKIYREFVEERIRRINVYREGFSIHKDVFYARADVIRSKEDREWVQEMLAKKLNNSVDKQQQWVRNRDEEQAKFAGIITEIIHLFKDSPEIKLLTETVLEIPEMNVKDVSLSDDLDTWVKNSNIEQDAFINKIQHSIDKLHEYLQQNLILT